MSKLFILVAGGDSITAMAGSFFFQAYGWTNTGDATQPETHTQCTYYNGSIIARNMAISGTRLAGASPNLTGLAPLYIDPIVANHEVGTKSGAATAATRRSIFTNGIGSNDGALGGFSTVAQYAASNAAQSVLRKTNGYTVCGMHTLLPRNDGLLTEPNRTAYNALISDSAWRMSNGIDFFIDLASQATMGNPANCGNTMWYVDGIHPTFAGYTLLAPIYKAAVDAIIATL